MSPLPIPNHETSAQQQLRLATVWPQQTWAENWGAAPLRRTGSPSNTMSPRPRPSSVPSGILIHPAIWPQQTWAKNWSVPLWGRGAVSPSNTVWPELRPTSMPSFILTDKTVWLQYTNVTDRTDRQTTVR